ncbi:MAG: polyribonucleotide nucleotidyltransferase [Bacteriovoracaceae bacterium]|jgi:polyribonucleotide nucleotidyltransferase|nr:polyribonucleotide nucleotidyltransferase [Bacteriovoracaceae bacterium]
MNEGKREYHLNYGGKDLTLETGRMAKQADGAVLVSSGGTQVLVTVCSAKEAPQGQDFFPLLVDYKEKFYSAGKFLGGYMKREGRPGDHEILLMRMVDRPFRPLFPDGYMCETIIMAQVVSFDKSSDPQVLAGLGAAAALAISDIPFKGPVGFCKVGKIDGALTLNPSNEELESSSLELVVSASKEAILMVEGEANLISEDEMLEAIMFAQKNIKDFCALVDTMVSEVGRTKRDFTVVEPHKKLMEKVTSDYSGEARECLNFTPKMERQDAIYNLEKKISGVIKEDLAAFGLEEGASAGKEAHFALDVLLYNMMRNDILKEGKRIGGRGLDVVREIETENSVLDKVHGSSLFTRGETQVLAAVTMGGKEGTQMRDRLHGLDTTKFYLHYTFAPFCVGEARGYRGVGRREVGHGNLAERAIKKVLPDVADFPYTLRVNCEVLESNGSSSMGSVCSGSMALMDAGVPLTAPVAGVAMGLIKDGDDYAILTDILGDEDHLGDMDFKVAGTKDGISAIQMDIKIDGISEAILKEALAKAKTGKLHILEEMAKTVSSHRAEMKDGVPQIETIQIKQDQIGGLIGPGGKVIRRLQEEFDVSIEVDDDAKVLCIGTNIQRMKECLEEIDLVLNGPKIGTDYDGKVVTVKEYGAFVEIGSGISGLLHVSEFCDERVKDVNEYVSEGDTVKVRILDVDRFGKVKLSAKAIKGLEPKK